MKNKKWMIMLICSIIAVIPVITGSCFLSGSFSTGNTTSGVKIEKIEEKDSGKLTEEEFEELMNNEDFLETFDTFYYPDSMVKEARAITDGQDMVYVILETDQEFGTVEKYYRDKKVQSIWNRDFLYQKSIADIEEEEFIEDAEEDILISKFTFSSKEKDKVVDVLVKELSPDRTQIMITYWDLQ